MPRYSLATGHDHNLDRDGAAYVVGLHLVPAFKVVHRQDPKLGPESACLPGVGVTATPGRRLDWGIAAHFLQGVAKFQPGQQITTKFATQSLGGGGHDEHAWFVSS